MRILLVCAAALVGVGVWLLTVGGPGPDRTPVIVAATPDAAPTASPTPSQAPAPSTTPAPSAALPSPQILDSHPEHAGTRWAPHDPAWRQQRQAAITTATASLEAFARPATPGERRTWWQRVSTYLAPRVVEDYRGTDPRSVPFSKVTGAAQLVVTEAPANLLTVVRVPTDAGWYVVELETDQTGTRVTAIVPIEARSRP